MGNRAILRTNYTIVDGDRGKAQSLGLEVSAFLTEEETEQVRLCESAFPSASHLLTCVNSLQKKE